MAGTLSLRVITPARILLDTTAASISFPTLDGSVGILKDHAPMVAALGVGELAYRAESGSEEILFVAGGFAEVRSNTVRVVTDVSEPISEIDMERANRAAERARKRLEQYESNEGENLDILRARASLARAIARQRAAGRRRS